MPKPQRRQDDIEDDDLDDMDLPQKVVVYDAPRTKLSTPNPVDPAKFGFPPMLPFELAMRTASVPEICDAYEISRDEFIQLVADPVFKVAYSNACDEIQKDGVTFKLKAKMQAEVMLVKAYEMVHNTACPFNVRADMMKAVIRWAGYEPQKGAGPGGDGSSFQIQINL